MFNEMLRCTPHANMHFHGPHLSLSLSLSLSPCSQKPLRCDWDPLCCFLTARWLCIHCSQEGNGAGLGASPMQPVTPWVNATLLGPRELSHRPREVLSATLLGPQELSHRPREVLKAIEHLFASQELVKPMSLSLWI